MWSLFLLRITIGWLMFYAGWSKIINPAWSAAGYLNAATTFSGFYGWLASPSMLPITNFLNEWGLLLLGAALILGVCTKWTSYLAAAMMILYYFPVLTFPTVAHGILVDEHIIYAVALLTLAAFEAGKVWGLEDKVCGMFKK